jgi:hypothetical protein
MQCHFRVSGLGRRLDSTQDLFNGYVKAFHGLSKG